MQVTDSFDEIQRNQVSVRVNPNPEHIYYTWRTCQCIQVCKRKEVQMKKAAL